MAKETEELVAWEAMGIPVEEVRALTEKLEEMGRRVKISPSSIESLRRTVIKNLTLEGYDPDVLDVTCHKVLGCLTDQVFLEFKGKRFSLERLLVCRYVDAEFRRQEKIKPNEELSSFQQERYRQMALRFIGLAEQNKLVQGDLVQKAQGTVVPSNGENVATILAQQIEADLRRLHRKPDFTREDEMAVVAKAKERCLKLYGRLE